MNQDKEKQFQDQRNLLRALAFAQKFHKKHGSKTDKEFNQWLNQ